MALTVLLVLLCVATGSLASAIGSTVRDNGRPDDTIAQSLRDLKTDIRAKLQLLDRKTPQREDGRLVLRDRAGVHVFRVRDGLAVDGQLGADRVYHVHEGVFVVKLCVCGGGCVWRYKPAFYCLAAAGCLLAALAVGLSCSALAQHWQLRRRLAAAAEDNRQLLIKGCSGGGGLSIQCDPVLLENRCFCDIKKVAI